MGLFTANRTRRDGRVTFVQLITSLAGFVLFSVMGGVLIAGLALPAVTVGSQAANGTAELFEELPEEFEQVTLPETSYIYAKDGTTLLATFFNQNRVVVPLEEISPWMQKAQVAIEDQRFWLHNGVDGEGLARAAYLMVSSDDTQGASTITQQLIKNMLLQAAEQIEDEGERLEAEDAATEITMARKIREWRLALAYEERLNEVYGTSCTAAPEVDCGKERVLEQYLNIAQYGTRLYGVEAAAQRYFSVSAAELNALQAATIAGITQNPTKWNPLRFPENTEIRRNQVLFAMYDQGILTKAEYDEYVAIPVEETLNESAPKYSCAASELAPFFCDYVTKVIAYDPAFNGEGNWLLNNGGLRIVTTLDPRMQREATEAVKNGIPPTDASGLEDALVALDVPTGEILAMTQNRDYDPRSEDPLDTAINYSVDRRYGGSRGFSPGSSFKPMILAEWLNTGHSLNQYVSGFPREWQGSDWRAACPEGGTFVGTWKPENVSASENGQRSVLSATAYSVNTAYVSMLSQLDLCNVRDMTEALGFHRSDELPFEVVPSMVLGSQNASPLTMASVFQTFANRGIHCEPRAILEITDLDGQPVEDRNGDIVTPPAEQCTQAIRQDVADGVAYALTKPLEYGTARRLDFDRPAGGKTGTAQSNRHLWFVGFTPQIATAVWAGNAETDVDLQRMEINGVWKRYWYGGDIAGPIWEEFMTAAHEGMPVLPLPTAPPQILNGVQLRVPDVVNTGLSPQEAQWAINDAGFQWAESTERLYRPGVPPGTIVDQTPEAGTSMGPGGTVTYYISSDRLPGWWTNWPSGWDPLTAPSDWWGGSWPPADWTPNNPSQGWDPNPDPDPDPTPTPTPTPGP